MKKLQLNMQGLHNPVVLTRKQLKNVLGGDPPMTNPASCCAHATDQMGGGVVWCCGLTQSAAIAQANSWATIQGFADVHWCCDSCSQSTSENCDVPA